MPPFEPKRSRTAETIGAAMDWAVSSLRAAGIEDAERDARFLLGAACGASRKDLIIDADRGLTSGDEIRLAHLVARRLAREPVSRILGIRAFYGRDFALSPATFDPRPDTETLIDAVFELAAEETWSGLPIRILDIGTGTGCLLITLLAELPFASGVGTDIDAAPLRVAERNGRTHGVAERARWIWSVAAEELSETFDLVVSNPPYVASAEIEALEPEVRLFDPRSALDGGKDGLDVYRTLVPALPHLVPNGWTVFEVGCGQALDVAELSGQNDSVRIWRDLAGRQRCVAWKTRSVDQRRKTLGLAAGSR